jgi:phosphoglycolate phosphatase
MDGTGTGDIRVVVVDLLGTTVDDDGALEGAFVEALGAIGTEPGTTDFEFLMMHARRSRAYPVRDVIVSMIPNERRAREALRVFELAFETSIARGDVQPIPGAQDALIELRANGMQVCLTDGLPPMSMTLLLEQLGWRALVDLAVAPGPGVRGFPWPDIALTAALRLGLDAVSRLAVVGDTTSDLLGGTRAGASVVAGVVTGAHSVEQLATAPHTHLFPSVADFAATLSGRAVPVS